MKVLVALVLSVLSVCVAADNARGFYVGGGVGFVMYDDDVIEVRNSRSAEIFGGYKYNSLLGLEVRAGQGVAAGKSDTYPDPANADAELPGDLERELGSYYSIYYKPELINDEAKLYLLLGYMEMDSTETVSGVSDVSVSESGASYGIGIGFVVTEKLNFNIEYRTLPESSANDIETTMASANFDYRF